MAKKATTKAKSTKKTQKQPQGSDAEANQEHMHQTSTTNFDNTRNPDAEYERVTDTSRQLDSNPAERQRMNEEIRTGHSQP